MVHQFLRRHRGASATEIFGTCEQTLAHPQDLVRHPGPCRLSKAEVQGHVDVFEQTPQWIVRVVNPKEELRILQLQCGKQRRYTLRRQSNRQDETKLAGGLCAHLSN